MAYATPLRRLMASLADAALILLTLALGYVIWWLVVLGRGQTPGKQVLGIRAVRRDGARAGWGVTFIREVVKLAVHGFMIGFFADAIFILLDEQERRSLSDRVADTVVVRN